MISSDESDPDAWLGGRLPLLHPANLTTEQQQVYQYIRDTKFATKKADFQADLPDVRLLGSFNAFLYSPKLGQGFLNWIDAESQHTSLSAPVRKIVILTVASAWHAAAELYGHTAIGLAMGLNAATISAIKEGREPAGLTGPEAAAYRFTRTLVTQQVPDSLYQPAVAAFGLSGVVDLVHLIGHYLTTSALLAAFAVPAPSS